jgi:hypothetical protein
MSLGGVALVLFVVGIAAAALGFWQGIQPVGVAGIVAIGVALLLLWIAGQMEEGERRQVSVYCSKCDQYLGTGNNFSTPCTRCGSNRYTTS